jgi:hypothetical protein
MAQATGSATVDGGKENRNEAGRPDANTDDTTSKEHTRSTLEELSEELSRDWRQARGERPQLDRRSRNRIR